MINPDVGGDLDADGIAGLSKDFAHGQVLNNHIGDLFDVQRYSLQARGRVEAQDGSV